MPALPATPSSSTRASISPSPSRSRKGSSRRSFATRRKNRIREISEAVKDLATRARGKKLKPDEYQGGTITVSNLGAYGIEFFDAIINPPQAMIVSVGAIVKKPVVDAKDQIVVGQRLAIGLSADHRVVDGAVGATYLAELRRLLENPTLMLI